MILTDIQREPSTCLTDAVERWLREIRPPVFVHDTIRRKMKRLKLTVEDIDHDRMAKLTRLSS